MEALPSTIYVAIGAIAAALIYGFWLLVSLIIAKDHKTSEFRQAWVDSLRSDVSELLGSLIALSTSWQCYSATGETPDKRKEFLESNLDRIGQIESQKARVHLRLNPDEHIKAINMLNEIKKQATSPDRLGSDEFVSSCNNLRSEMQKILKQEWERVKQGERAFRLSRNIAFSVVLVAGIAFLYKLYA